jgi:hypothetical protein
MANSPHIHNANQDRAVVLPDEELTASFASKAAKPTHQASSAQAPTSTTSNTRACAASDNTAGNVSGGGSAETGGGKQDRAAGAGGTRRDPPPCAPSPVGGSPRPAAAGATPKKRKKVLPGRRLAGTTVSGPRLNHPLTRLLPPRLPRSLAPSPHPAHSLLPSPQAPAPTKPGDRANHRAKSHCVRTASAPRPHRAIAARTGNR